MPIPLLEIDKLKCPHQGVAILESKIGQVANIQGIPIMDTSASAWAISGCQGFWVGNVKLLCTSITNPHACKADKFKVLGKFVADAEKVNKLKTDKGFSVTLPNPYAKPFVKR